MKATYIVISLPSNSDDDKSYADSLGDVICSIIELRGGDYTVVPARSMLELVAVVRECKDAEG